MTFCPDLKELRLAMIQPRNLIQPSNPGQVEQTSTFNYDYHFSIMSNHCPKLQVFHYSERNAQTKSEQYLMAMWKAFPQLFTWSVLVSNLRGSPDPMAAFPMSLVANFINQLTTLELLAPFGTSREYLSVGFHQLLCAAPSLMHIKAKDIDFDMEATDLDRNTCRDTGHHSVWACRNLRTFHIRVRPEDRFTSSFTADHKNLSSRKFFAYLSRCCPRLQDIHIQYSALMTGLESGFCLLGELRYLERLHLRTISGSNIKQRDFDWLSTKNPRSQPVQERMRRWNIVNGLKDSKLDNQAKRGNRAKGKQVNSNEEEQLSFAIQRASGLRGQWLGVNLGLWLRASVPQLDAIKSDISVKPRNGHNHQGSLDHRFDTIEAMLDYVTLNWMKHFVTCDVHTVKGISILRKRPFFLSLSVESPMMVRYRRFTARCKEQELSVPTLESFVEMTDDSLYAIPTQTTDTTAYISLSQTSILSNGFKPNQDSTAKISDQFEEALPLSPLQSMSPTPSLTPFFDSPSYKLLSMSDLSILNNFADISSLQKAIIALDITNPDLLRPSWDSYFMYLANLAARRSNCMKRRVGCVLVREKRVIATGYNGTPKNLENCNNGGCSRCNQATPCGRGLDRCLCMHAEENALLEAGRERVGRERCAIKIVQVGVSQVVYSESYGMDSLTAEVFRKAGVELRQHATPSIKLDQSNP
ncbi:Deoxycytidine monophosphate (dCMP) deaminase [Mortierella sp. AM989]|nr:Deoxycytidine monophosphate (dCMP) deaminase [Mortierella sp. AM989]